jgi:hypothetical protein
MLKRFLQLKLPAIVLITLCPAITIALSVLVFDVRPQTAVAGTVAFWVALYVVAVRKPSSPSSS